MPKEKKDRNFIRKPIYKGGAKAMRAFIRDNLRYPEAALKEKVEGTVVLKYSIDYKGNVVDTRVISGLGHGCDEEAERLARLLKFEVPKTRGVKVLFYKDIKIHFRIPKGDQQPKAAAPAIQYSYTEKKKEVRKEKPGPKGSGGYSYTVDF